MNKLKSVGRKVPIVFLVALLLGLLVTPVAWAFSGREGNTVLIAADEVIDDDLYVAAGELRMEGTVRGDLFVMGETTYIDGIVEGDVIAMGRDIYVDGTIGGDLFAAGQQVSMTGQAQEDAYLAGYLMNVRGSVAEDLLSAGFSLTLDPGSSVGRQMRYGGYQLAHKGEVAGDALIGAGAVSLAGAIGGDAKIDVSGDEPVTQGPQPYMFMPNIPQPPSVPVGLSIEKGARIDGNLNCTANKRVTVPTGVVKGSTNFTEYVPESKEEAAAPTTLRGIVIAVLLWIWRQVRRLITFLLVGALMLWLIPRWTQRLANTVEEHPLPSLGWGALSMALIFVVGFALVILTILLALLLGVLTLGQLAGLTVSVGLLATGAFGVGSVLLWRYVTTIAISLLVGQLILRLFKAPGKEMPWWSLVIGVFLFVAFTAIPILGGLVKLATVLLGLGSVWLWARDGLRERREPVSATIGETDAEEEILSGE